MLEAPARKSRLIVHSESPYNAEPPLTLLRATYITAQRDFYVRSHGNIPRVDAASHQLHVTGLVDRSLNMGMDVLRARFQPRKIRAVMQCAGNRRSDMLSVRPVLGDPWEPGAIGNAEWTGVALADVLRAAGAEHDDALHVAFAALDDCEADGENFRYGVSIPMSKAMSPDVLLAYEMNGEPLAPEHGYPLRMVVPGFAGVRSPKWLSSITVQDRPSEEKPQARDYKLFPANVTKETANWQDGTTINDMPLNSAICEPAPFATLGAGATTVRGYAVATARQVARVDVSIDGGRSWHQADLEFDSAAPWSWTFWQAEIDMPKGEHEVTVRAWDSAGQTQPALADDVWNFKGYLCAAWHRIRVNVE